MPDKHDRTQVAQCICNNFFCIFCEFYRCYAIAWRWLSLSLFEIIKDY